MFVGLNKNNSNNNNNNNNNAKLTKKHQRRTLRKKAFDKFIKKRQRVINSMKAFSKTNKLPLNIKKNIGNLVYQMEFANNSNNNSNTE